MVDWDIERCVVDSDVEVGFAVIFSDESWLTFVVLDDRVLSSEFVEFINSFSNVWVELGVLSDAASFLNISSS